MADEKQRSKQVVPGEIAKNGYCREGKTVWFGRYPQSVSREGITFSDEAFDGICSGSDGGLYVKSECDPMAQILYSLPPRFHDGRAIPNGKIRFFKVEPIRFSVLEEREDKMLLLSDTVLDAQPFYDFYNDSHDESRLPTEDGQVLYHDYAFSDIRSFLNSEFLLTAFTKEERARIVPDEMVGGDYVFLPSKEDLSKREYGFIDFSRLPKRSRIPSDYALAHHVGSETVNQVELYAEYWTRTATKGRPKRVTTVTPSGSFLTWECHALFVGVLPMLWIKK